jgi:hypothetical protein
MCEGSIYAAVERRTREALGFRSIRIASAVPQPRFGRAEIYRTCEASRTCLVTRHSVPRKSITLWRSRVSRAVRLPVPSKADEKGHLRACQESTALTDEGDDGAMV